MLYAEDFRQIARKSLKSRWWLSVGTGIIASLFGADISTLTHNWNYTVEKYSERISQNDNYLLNEQFGISHWSIVDFLRNNISSDISMIVEQLLAVLILIIPVLFIISIIIGGAVTLGYARFNLAIVDRKGARFHYIFSQFGRIGAGFCMQFLRGLYVFLWTLLLIIPGIIAVYSYSMTPYIMVEHPEYGANDAISRSKKLMRGNKWRFFCLELSFIGWALLSILTLGIGFIWLSPYIEAANAAFYRDISSKNPHE